MSEAQKSATSQDKILAQLKRINGQIDGVVRMYEDERVCVDIVRQIMAVRSSLARVARDLLTDEASRCTKKRQAEELDAVLKELFRY
jgi:DNA-binding FrmR family transcriptional regulator